MLTLLEQAGRWLRLAGRQTASSDVSLLLPRQPQDVSHATQAIIQRVRPFTMTSPERIACLCRGVAHVIRAQVPGAIVECGVWRGGSMMAAALTLLDLDATRDLYLFDTFAGMPEPSDIDTDMNGRSAHDWLLEAGHMGDMVRANCPLIEARLNLGSTGYDLERIVFVEGKVEETLPERAPEQIAILRLDTDWYASTYHEMVHLFPRLSPGGLLLVDDYGHWRGARQAVDQYFGEQNLSLPLHAIDYTGRLAIRPGTPGRSVA